MTRAKTDTDTVGNDRDAYYRQAESWNRDREVASRRSRQIAWIVASIAAFIALAEACALVALMPLKTVQPYTLLVDRQTGYVQALDPLQPTRVGADTALTQSFVVQYVIARESFDIAAAQANYKKVAGWSEGAVRARYIAQTQTSNPDSPLNTLPRSSVVETRVKSVSVTGRNMVLVRFDTQRRDDNGQVHAAQPWIAVVRYRYTGEPMTLEQRLVDPLGFRVTHYQRSAEALVPDAQPVTPSSAPSTDQPAVGQATVAPSPLSSGPAGVANRITPSPLSGVRQPRYVIIPGVPRQAIIGMSRSGQPIVGQTR